MIWSVQGLTSLVITCTVIWSVQGLTSLVITCTVIWSVQGLTSLRRTTGKGDNSLWQSPVTSFQERFQVSNPLRQGHVALKCCLQVFEEKQLCRDTCHRNNVLPDFFLKRKSRVSLPKIGTCFCRVGRILRCVKSLKN